MSRSNPAYAAQHTTRRDYLINASLYAKRGNDLPRTKLTPEKVKEIRANRYGKTAQQLADEHGVHKNTIDKIRNFETWAHV